MRFGWKAQDASKRIYRLASVASLVLLAIYVIIYWFQPFTEYWNNFFSNFFLVLVALIAAVVASMVWALYDRTDSPRLVWGPLAIGLWLWFAADFSWAIYNMTVGNVPIGVPDLFWILSYFIFGFALLNQYRILFQPASRDLWKQVLLLVSALLVLTLAIYLIVISSVEMPNTLDAVINSFYPAADILLATIALWLAHKFMGGAFARPWIGLLIFSFADFLYAWLETSGNYAWSLEHGNLLSTISDITYLAAYLVLFMGVLHQWLFLKYGLRSATEP
jgi:hypothetical protein